MNEIRAPIISGLESWFIQGEVYDLEESLHLTMLTP